MVFMPIFRIIKVCLLSERPDGREKKNVFATTLVELTKLVLKVFFFFFFALMKIGTKFGSYRGSYAIFFMEIY